MPLTPKLSLPYPVLPDPADVPADMGELAVAIDDKAAVANGLATLGADGKVPTAQLPPVPGSIPPTIFDAKGDLLGASADDTPVRIPAGAPGDVLIIDPAAPGGLRWATPAAGDISATIIDAKGDLIVGLGPDTPGRLPAGSDGQSLIADSSLAAGVKWGAPPASSGIPAGLLDAKGDLIAASANDTPTRVGVGTDGQVLAADAASPAGVKWIPAPSSLPPTTGHEGEWLKVSGGAVVWSPQYDVPLATVTAKGDLIGATGPGAVTRIPVGTDGKALLADAASAAGVKWGDVSSVDYENAWNAGTSYLPGDVVNYNGVEYLAVNPSTGQTPPAGSNPTRRLLYDSGPIAAATAMLDSGTLPIVAAELTDLLIVLVGRATLAAAQSVQIRCNNDAAANYDQQTLVGSVAAATAGRTAAATSAIIGTIPGSNAGASVGGCAFGLVPNYAIATPFFKTGKGEGGYIATAVAEGFAVQTSWQWRSLAAITRVQLIPTGGNFDVGTRMMIYAV